VLDRPLPYIGAMVESSRGASIPSAALHKTTGDRWAITALLCGALLIALAPIFVRLSETGPTATGFWRLALAAPVLLAWDGLYRPRSGASWRPSRAGLGLLAAAGACFAGDLAAWHTSIELTSVANATLLANAAPIFVAAAAWAWLGEKPGFRFIAGLGLASVGGVLLARESAGAQLHLAGDALGLLTAAFYAGYMLVVKVLRARLATSTVMAGSTVVGALILLPLALAFGDTMLPTTFGGWSVLIALALLSQVCGQGLIAWAIGHLTASFSALGLLSQTAAAAALAWILFGESFTILQSVGLILVAVGLVVARASDTAAPLARKRSPV
jgi:drug/metabolite transporter (DMT)-like permease